MAALIPDDNVPLVWCENYFLELQNAVGYHQGPVVPSTADANNTILKSYVDAESSRRLITFKGLLILMNNLNVLSQVAFPSFRAPRTQVLLQLFINTLNMTTVIPS